MRHFIIAAAQLPRRLGSYASALLFVTLVLAGGYVAMGRAEEQFENGQVEPPKAKIVTVDEVHIQQETGRISNTAKSTPQLGTASKTAPEGSSPSAVPAGATSPNTCDPKNASSPVCYTATQQGRGK
jgi:hypothetical protein